jgi:hypothetical protein
MAQEKPPENFDVDNPHADVDIEKIYSDLSDSAEAPEEDAETVEIAEAVEEDPQEDEESEPGDEVAEAKKPDTKEAAWLKQKTAQDKELRDLRKRIKEYDDAKPSEPDQQEQKFVAEFFRDPGAFLKRHGADSKAGALGKRLLAVALGDDAPEHFKEQVDRLSLEARLEALESGIREEDSSRVSTQTEAARHLKAEMLQSDLNELLEDVDGFVQSFPYTGVLASDNLEEARSALQIKAVELVRSGKWPSAQRVAQELNKELERSVSRFKALTGPTLDTADDEDTPDESGNKRKQSKPLSNAKGAKRKRNNIRKEQENWTKEQWDTYGVEVLGNLFDS